MKVLFIFFCVWGWILDFNIRLAFEKSAVKKNRSVKSLDSLIFNYRSVLGRGSYWKNHMHLFDDIFGSRPVTNTLLSSVTNIKKTLPAPPFNWHSNVQFMRQRNFQSFFLLVSFWWPSENRTRYISVRSYRLDRGALKARC